MTDKNKSTFDILNNIDVSKYVEKKGQFNYLSWAYAVRELLKACPTATWEVHLFVGEDGTKQPYMKDGTGSYVQVSVDVEGVVRSQIHPVLDHRNKPIDNPNSFQINTSIQRCLAKAIALHGLGLYIFAGEDLPEVNKPEPVKMTTAQKKTILETLNSDESPLSEDERNNTLKWLESERTKGDADKLISKLNSKMKNPVNLQEMVDGVFGNGSNN